MGRTCAVPGCHSGRGKDNRERKRLGLRRRILFSIPKCNDRLGQWKNVLGCELAGNQYVCEIHFPEKAIKKVDETVLGDGTVYVSPLVQWHLQADAVPISSHHESTKYENNNNGMGEVEHDDIEIRIERAEDERSNAIDRNETTNAVSSDPAEPPLADVPLNVEMAETDFTMGHLMDEMKAGPLPESWAWTQKSSGAVFTLLDRSNFHPRLQLEVALDLTWQIRTNTDNLIPLNGGVTSMKDISDYLEFLKEIEICRGTGIESESRDPHCMGILDPKEGGNCQRRNLRCVLCQRFHDKLRKRDERRKKSASAKAQTVKKVDYYDYQ